MRGLVCFGVGGGCDVDDCVRFEKHSLSPPPFVTFFLHLFVVCVRGIFL
jgi:hypothetical protein